MPVVFQRALTTTGEETYVNRDGDGDVDGDGDWERRSAAAWESIDAHGEEEFRALIDGLADELPPGSPVAAFERACAFDSTGHPDRAVPLYREALKGTLPGERRRRAVIQLASSLRNLGQQDESIALLTAELDAGSDHLDDAVRATLALALTDVGREREAVSLAVGALARHLPRYQRSMANYARLLVEPGPAEPGSSHSPKQV
ncbi:tetratricopeptide repeat protein [Streptomyces sp. NPDC048172]|uniref:tetratricopeptide repeat protein n=1 Tax=Streptomyces sp. NPDC048172 TaxID=3365505 RepID=UPI00371702B6